MTLDYNCHESLILEKALHYWLDGYGQSAPGRPETQALLERVETINRVAGAPTCMDCISCRSMVE